MLNCRRLMQYSIPYNPVFFAYAIVTPITAELYIDDDKLTPEVKSHLGQDVIIKPYDSIFADAKALSESRKQAAGEEGAKFLLSNKASWALSLNLGARNRLRKSAALSRTLRLSRTKQNSMECGLATSETALL